MNSKALETVKKFNMLSQGDRVCVAVSGGADSMALLCFLLEIRDEFSLELVVCHVNHLLRGKEADRDEDFVRNFCLKNNLDFRLHRQDVSALAREMSIGFEECGRLVRYRFFEDVLSSMGGGKIATAHTLSDSEETLIFNLTRGSGISGMSSISPVRGNIIRPLIECTREEIEKYLLGISQGFVTDSTNSDTEYTRNYIRKEIVPRLKKLNSNFDSAVLNLTSLSREAADFLSVHTQGLKKELYSQNGYSLELFLPLHICEKRGIISDIFRENNIEFSKKLCDDIIFSLESGDFKRNVCKGKYFVSKGGYFFIEAQSEHAAEAYEYKLSLGETSLPDGRSVKLSLISYEQFIKFKENSKKLLKNCINYDIIDDSFVLRSRKEGDFISLFPRNVTKTLKKLLNESKISREKRDIMPLVASGSHIIWGEGIGVDSAAAVTSSAKNILFIEIE